MKTRSFPFPAQLSGVALGLFALVGCWTLTTLLAAAPAVAQETTQDGHELESDWLVDEERDQRYRVAKVPKIEGTYRWVDDATVRFRHGIYFDVVNHDDEWFWVKHWESVRSEIPPPPPSETPEARKERIVAAYEYDIPTADRLVFEGFEEGLPKSGQWRQGFDIADANNDGHLDIVYGPPRKTTRPVPHIYLGDGAGNWKLWTDVNYPRAPYDYGDAAAGDFNGDGLTDLVFGVHLRGMVAMVADGEGGFDLWSEGIGIDHPGRGGDATNFSSRAVDVIDWNKDGKLDILALGEGPKGRKSGPKGQISGEIINNSRGLVVFLNQGDGTWVPERPGDEVGMSFDFGDGFARGDFNRDGKTDIALASRRMSSRGMLGIYGDEGLWMTHNLDPLRPRSFVGAVATADIDGDGGDELVVGYQSHEEDDVVRTGIDVFYAGDDLAWERRPVLVSEGRRGVYAVETGDIDGDGAIDIVAVTGDAEVWALLGDGNGSFVREEVNESPAVTRGCRGYGLRLEDLDGDGGDEIVVSFAGEQTGFPGIEGMSSPGCERQGSLRAWKAVAKTTPAATSAP